MREAWRLGEKELDRRARATAYQTAALVATGMGGKRLPDYEAFVMGDDKPNRGGKNAAERREDLQQRRAADEAWINRLAAEGKL
jgi:hypothetical protein